MSAAESCWGWVKGLEPSTYGTTTRRSSQLSYTHRVCLSRSAWLLCTLVSRDASPNFNFFSEPSQRCACHRFPLPATARYPNRSMNERKTVSMRRSFRRSTVRSSPYGLHRNASLPPDEPNMNLGATRPPEHYHGNGTRTERPAVPRPEEETWISGSSPRPAPRSSRA